MNAVKTLLIWFGYAVIELGERVQLTSVITGESIITTYAKAEEVFIPLGCSMRYGSVEEAARQAADWWNQLGGKCEYQFRNGKWFDVYTPTSEAIEVNPLKVIAEAVIAGWKG